MKRKKSTWNLHEAEGIRDGKNKDTVAMCIRWNSLKFYRDNCPNSPMLPVHEENYSLYKKAFLENFERIK